MPSPISYTTYNQSELVIESIVSCVSLFIPFSIRDVVRFRRLSSPKLVPLSQFKPPLLCKDLDTSTELVIDSTSIDRYFPIIDDLNAPLSSLPCYDDQIFINFVQSPHPSCPSEIARSIGHSTMFLDHNSFGTHYLTDSRHFFPSVSLFSKELLWINNSLRVLNKRELCENHSTLLTARDLMIAASSLPQKEVCEFQTRLSELLSCALDMDVIQGYRGIDLACHSKQALIFGAEVKLDQGSADALTQIMVYYQRFWDDFIRSFSTGRRVRNYGHMPSVLAEIKGRFLSLYGAVTVIRHGQPHRVVEHFVTTSLLFSKHNEFEVHYLANILRILSEGLDRLVSFYNNLFHGPTLNSLVCQFPLLGSDEFTYIEHIHPTSPVYVATNKSTGRDVVVKCTRAYNEQIHRLFADHNLAPDLYSCRQLADQLFLIEMEYLNPENYQVLNEFVVPSDEVKQKIFNQLELVNSFATQYCSW
ncbi:hypothetical protein RCL1_008659 [Eukaryota sp. TZLM3-RCL]